MTGPWEREPCTDCGTVDAEDFAPDPPQRATPLPPGSAAYCGLFGDLVSTLEPHSEADPVGLLVQALAMFGSIIGRGPYWQVEDTPHHLNLFGVLVGPTGKGRKGTSGDRIRTIGRRLDPNWRTENGLVSGEGLIWAVRDAETGEKGGGNGRAEADAGIADKRLFVAEPEFARVLRTMEREGSSLSPVLREAWDGGVLSSLSKQSRGRATDAHISIIGHITADELRRYLTQTEAGNGFGNRFLWVWVTRSKELPEGGSLQEHELAPILMALRAALDSSKCVGRIGFDAEARDLWHDVYHDLSSGRPGLLGSMTMRAEAQTRRLACLYALADRASTVEGRHLEAALALWDYCYRSAEHIFGNTLGDPIADELLRALRHAGSVGLTRTEINIEVFGRNRTSHDITRGLSVLAEAELAYRRTDHTTTRPTERWFVSEATKSTNFTK